MLSMASMEGSTIALIIRYFNIVSVIVLTCCAIYGLVVVILGRLGKKHPAGFLAAFCAASLLAFAAETVFFNYAHYLKYFAGEEFSITMLSNDIEMSDAGIDPDISGFVKDDGQVVVQAVTFKNVNRKVTSVFIQPVFNDRERLGVRMRWTDESDVLESVHDFRRTLYKALPHENHIAVQCAGNVSVLEIAFSEPLLISQIAVNRQIPFYFNGLRLFVVSLPFFAIILFACKPLRAKTAYYLFEYKFDPTNKKQNIVYVCLVILLLVFSWFCNYTSKVGEFLESPMNRAHNRYLVDALIAGRTNVDFGQPEKLLNIEKPYNAYRLISKGYSPGVTFDYDISYYKGKFYVYYSAVPVVLCYLPYKLITGTYMSQHAVIFAFASIAVIFLALLWRFLVKKYMPNARFAFVLLSFLTLFFLSFLFCCIRQPCYGTVPQVSGLAFYVAGTFLLLKSVDKEMTNHLRIFFACLCFALAVGCRPNMVLLSIIVPTVLWKRRSWKLAAFILIPYIMVAIPLCIYNYVRFDSIFEFGLKYIPFSSDLTTRHLLNPLGKIHRTFITFIYYLFRLYGYSLYFPFVELIPPLIPVTFTHANGGFMMYHDCGGGLINFPILFCLLYLFKNITGKDKPRGFYLSSVFFIIAVVMILAFSSMGTFHERYLMDCAVFLVCSSLFCAYWFCNDKRVGNDVGVGGVGGEVGEVVGWGDLWSSESTIRLKIIYALLVISIIVGLFRVVSGSDHGGCQAQDPALYRYLEHSLGIIERS